MRGKFTKKRIYKCPDCDFKSVSRGGLAVHQRHKHSNSPKVEELVAAPGPPPELTPTINQPRMYISQEKNKTRITMLTKEVTFEMSIMTKKEG